MKKIEHDYFTWLDGLVRKGKIEFFDVELHREIASTPGFSRLKIISGKAQFGDLKVWCTGAGWSVEQALLKCSVECIERLFMMTLSEGQSSNGIACHFDLQKAKQAAVNELLERDALFTQFLLGEPFNELPHTKREPIRQQTFARAKNFSYDFFKMSPAIESRSAVLCVIKSDLPHHGWLCLGAACNSSSQIAKQRSLLEAVTIFNATLHGHISPYRINEMKRKMQLNAFAPHEHAQLPATEVRKFAETYFLSSKQKRQKRRRGRKAFEVNRTAFKIFNLQMTEFAGSNLYCAVARNEDLQKPFWGFPRPEDVNFRRLLMIRPDLKVSDILWDRLHIFA